MKTIGVLALLALTIWLTRFVPVSPREAPAPVALDVDCVQRAVRAGDSLWGCPGMVDLQRQIDHLDALNRERARPPR